MTVVIDASVLFEFLIGGGSVSVISETLIEDNAIAPDLVNSEVCSVLNKAERRKLISSERAQQAVDDLTASPIRRVSTSMLMQSAWSFRKNITIYDGCYVALAQELDIPLITTDEHLAKVAKKFIEVDLLSANS